MQGSPILYSCWGYFQEAQLESYIFDGASHGKLHNSIPETQGQDVLGNLS